MRLAIEPRPILTIGLDAIAHNHQCLAATVAPAECAAVCKADGYGLGVDAIGRALSDAGVMTFFVATITEGVHLRRSVGPEPSVFILNGVTSGEYPELTASQLWPVISTTTQLQDAIHHTAQASAVPCALHVDTGMNRLGLPPATAEALASDPAAKSLDVRVVMSHLGSAEEPDDPVHAQQADSFDELVQMLRPIYPSARRSLAATSGITLGSRYHYDLARPGIGLYGGLSFPDIRHVATLTAPIIQLRDIPSGAAVGYGATWRASRPSRIATLPIGYADGVLRNLSNVGTAHIDGRAAPLVGRINMDLTTIDVTDIPGVEPGTMVELIGEYQFVDDVAEAAGTIPHEVLTALRGGRYERRYVGATN